MFQRIPWLTIFGLGLGMVCCLNTLQAQSTSPAFPGAEGFGRHAKGGRAGEVYHVTHLGDQGPGSFREAVSKPNRTIVFDTNGVITLESRIIVSSDLTIAGQTAPGDGITLYGNGLSYSGANNTITRHIRIRMGAGGDSGKDAITIASGRDMMFDHVSVSWGRDETFSISGPVTNVTIQNSIIAQGLQPHSCGGLIQTDGGVSILRTLYIDNHTRNPKVKGVNQFVNNVVYNWGGGGAYILGDSEGPSFANVVNNYFIDGPSTSVAAFTRGNLNFQIFAANNFQDSNRNGSLDGTLIPESAYGTVAWQKQPYPYPAIIERSPMQAVKWVAGRSGASAPRDAIDRQLIGELLSYGRIGMTINRESGPPKAGTDKARVPIDTDQDGMPDFWELANNLNPKNPSDRNSTSPAGYTRLEEYLNWLAVPHAVATRNESVTVDLDLFVGGAATPFVISRVQECTVALGENGRKVRVMPRKDFVGVASFRFAPADEPSMTETVQVLVSSPGTLP